MRLKPVFIITSLLTGHAVGLPRPQERSEENSYDQGDLARDATLVLGTGLVTGGSVWYLNEKSTAKQIEQLKSGQRDMRVKLGDLSAQIDNSHLDTQIRLDRLQQQTQNQAGSQNAANQPTAAEQPKTVDKTKAASQLGISKTVDLGQTKTTNLQVLFRVEEIVAANEALEECILEHLLEEDFVNYDRFKGILADGWNRAADQCKHIPGWTENVKYHEYGGQGWVIRVGNKPIQLFRSAADDQPTRFSTSDVKGLFTGALKQAMDKFSPKPGKPMNSPVSGTLRGRRFGL